MRATVKNTSAPMPWPVAETVAEMLLREAPIRLHLCEDVGSRIERTISHLMFDDDVDWTGTLVSSPEGADCAVWTGPFGRELTPPGEQVLEIGEKIHRSLIIVEAMRPDGGLGLSVLRGLDRGLRRLSCDELPDQLGGTRRREPWEARAPWSVATVAAWRFQPGAEEAREGFFLKLPALQSVPLFDACTRILDRWPYAQEVAFEAIRSLTRPGHAPGTDPIHDVRNIIGLMERVAETSTHQLRRARRMLADLEHRPARPYREDPARHAS